MCKICPSCGAIAEYNAYYGRTTCTRCSWVSEKALKKPAKTILSSKSEKHFSQKLA